MSIYQYLIAAITETGTAGAGSINTSIGSASVTGNGAADFTLIDKDTTLMLFNGEVHSIHSIAGAHTLTLNTGAAATLSTEAYNLLVMKNVEDLTTLPETPSTPKGNWQPWAQAIPLGDGLARGLGRPLAQWQWNYGANDFVGHALRDALRTYCTGKSARVWIHTKTLDSSDVYTFYEAALWWPDSETREAGRRLKFELTFRDLVVI